jgi:putative ATP-binding cassette transporter
MNEDLSEHGTPFIASRPINAWQLVKSYWQSDQRFYAYLFFAIAMILTILLVGIDVLVSYWSSYFYTAVQQYDKRGVIRLFIVFCILATFFILLAVYRYYMSQLFSLRWRRWLTNQLMGRWLKHRAYYLIETFDKQTDNPDQRIQEDISSLVSSTIDLSVGLISSVTTLFAFIYILWQLSGNLKLSFGSLGTLHIAGGLVWVSIIYALIGTYFTIKIGRPLVSLNFEQQKREATFRFAAVDLRLHSEHIALYRGEHHQNQVLNRLFSRVLDNWYMIILRQKLLLWFTSGYGQIAIIVPLLVALPNYFNKVFLLGGLMQSIRAFGSTQESLSFIVNSYTQLAQWQAISQRLTTFINHMNELEIKAAKENHLVFRQHADNSILVRDLKISLPSGQILIKNINETFKHGQNYLIKGASGIGKSTFVRSLAGIWPFASGEIIFPEHQQVMYLPQKSYMPIGTLADALLFPDGDTAAAHSQLQQALTVCQLESFIPRLYETASWSEQLSPGEQQRIAFARVLLQKPDWVFLDESTSMLDTISETQSYEMLKTQLPHCSIISVGHRPSLDAYHDHIIHFKE